MYIQDSVVCISSNTNYSKTHKMGVFQAEKINNMFEKEIKKMSIFHKK